MTLTIAQLRTLNTANIYDNTNKEVTPPMVHEVTEEIINALENTQNIVVDPIPSGNPNNYYNPLQSVVDGKVKLQQWTTEDGAPFFLGNNLTLSPEHHWQELQWSPGANISMNGWGIEDVADPINDQDVANKRWVLANGGAGTKAGNVLFVSTTGVNATAVKGNAAKPYLTLDAAIAAAVAGDVIYVFSGTYNPTTNLFKDGVGWIFEDCLVERTTAGHLFDTSIVLPAYDFKIFGNARFKTSGAASNCFYLSHNANITIIINANTILSTSSEAITVYNFGYHFIIANEIKSTASNALIQTYSGGLKVIANIVSTANATLNISLAGSSYYSGTIESTVSHAISGISGDGILTVIGKLIAASGFYSINRPSGVNPVGNGKIYVEGILIGGIKNDSPVFQGINISNAITINGIIYGKIVNSDGSVKLNGNVINPDGNIIAINVTGGDVTINGNIDIYCGNFYGITVTGGTLNCGFGIINTSNTALFSVTGGKVLVKSAKVIGGTVDNNTLFNKTGGTLILEDTSVVITKVGQTDFINGTLGQIVKIMNVFSNKAVNANITQQIGTVTVDTNVE